jgi:hypothetical protein
MSTFTVVIPAYNGSGTIGRAVKSALRESPRVIVVDDGSSDDTASIARAAGATVLYQPNAGPGAARNTALASLCASPPPPSGSRASPVVFLDADDEFLPGAAASISGAFAAHPSAAAVVAGHQAVARNGRRTARAPDRAWLAAGLLPDAALALGPYHVFCTSGLVLSPGAAGQLRFDPALHFAEDRDLIYRAGGLGPVAVIAGPLIRKHTGAGLTDDPGRVRRWLRDQLTLVVKHCPPAAGSDPRFVPLRECTEWVVSHASKVAHRTGSTFNHEEWTAISTVFKERGWTPVPGPGRASARSAGKTIFAALRARLTPERPVSPGAAGRSRSDNSPPQPAAHDERP